MNEKLKRVVELAKQLQEAVEECGNVLSVCIEPESGAIESYILVHGISKLDGLEFDRDVNGMRWFQTNAYGFRIDGAVIGGDDQ